MARRKKQSALTAKDYRQFAAMTLGAVGLLVVFTDDSEVASHIPAAQPATKIVIADVAGQPRNPVPRPARSFSDERSWVDGDDAIGPTDQAALIGNYTPAQDASVSGKPSTTPTLAEMVQIGIGSQQFAQLSRDQQSNLLDKTRAGANMVSPAEREAQIETLIAASAARSGSATDVDG